MNNINVLLVGTSTLSKDIPGYIRFSTLYQMEQYFKDKKAYGLFEELNNKHLVRYYYNENLSSDESESSNSSIEYQDYYDENKVELLDTIEIDSDDIPVELLYKFMGNIHEHDFIKNIKLFVNNIKILFPNVETINYTTIDYYTHPPKFYGLEKQSTKINKKFSKKYNIKFKHTKHICTSFQTFIKENKNKFNVIFFFGCCNPHYLVGKNEKYINNFKKSLDINGYILYADPMNSHILTMVSLINRMIYLIDNCGVDKNKLNKVKFLCNYLIELDEGIYQFIH